MTLRNPEDMKACNALNLIEGSRLHMIKNIIHNLLEKHSAVHDGHIFLMGKEDRSADDDGSSI